MHRCKGDLSSLKGKIKSFSLKVFVQTYKSAKLIYNFYIYKYRKLKKKMNEAIFNFGAYKLLYYSRLIL